MVFRFALAPYSLNQLLRQHWSVRRKQKRCWAVLLLVAMNEHGFSPKGKFAPKMRLKLTITRKRRLDRDNLVGGCKPLIDAIKDAGIIRDDSPGWLDLEVEQQIGSPMTVIEISESTGGKR